MTDQLSKRVFAFPVKIVLECKLYVLATDPDDAFTEVTKVDLQDLIDWNDIQCSVHSGRMVIDDIHTTDPDAVLDADDAEEMRPDQYNPTEHPDFLGVGTK